MDNVKIEPCPYCQGQCIITSAPRGMMGARLLCKGGDYAVLITNSDDMQGVISLHNTLCRAMRSAPVMREALEHYRDDVWRYGL
jgi:hypothetical protein